MYMNKQDLASNNLQRLMCYKIKLSQITALLKKEKGTQNVRCCKLQRDNSGQSQLK